MEVGGLLRKTMVNTLPWNFMNHSMFFLPDTGNYAKAAALSNMMNQFDDNRPLLVQSPYGLLATMPPMMALRPDKSV